MSQALISCSNVVKIYAGGAIVSSQTISASRDIHAARLNPLSDDELATATSDGVLSIYDSIEGGFRFSKRVDITADERHIPVNTIAYGPGGDMVAVGFKSGYLKIFDIVERRQVVFIKDHHSEMLGLAWAQDGSWLSSVSRYGDIYLHKAVTGTVLTKFEEASKSEGYRSLALSKDSRTLFAGTNSGQLCLFDITKRSMLGAPAPLHRRPVSALECLSANTVFSVGDETVMITDLREMKSRVYFKAEGEDLSALALFRGEQSGDVAVGSRAGGITLLDLRKSDTPKARIAGQEGAIRSLQFGKNPGLGQEPENSTVGLPMLSRLREQHLRETENTVKLPDKKKSVLLEEK
jgi:WD40 repeat protein